MHVFFGFHSVSIKDFQQGTKQAVPIRRGQVLGLGDNGSGDLGAHHTKMLGFWNSRTKALCFCVKGEGVTSNSHV